MLNSPKKPYCKHCGAHTHTSLRCALKPKKVSTPLNTLKRAQMASETAKQPKQKTLSKLKGEADTWFSRFVRLRDAYDVNGEWWSDCVTCGLAKPYKEQQAGHFISRGKLITRFHPQNVHTQSVSCNMFRQGEQYAHAQYIDKRYGAGTADSLVVLSAQTKKMTREDYEKIIYDAKKFILEKTGSLTSTTTKKS